MKKCCKIVLTALLVICVLILAITLIAVSVKPLQSYEVGLKYDTVFLKLEKEILAPGLHQGPPGFKLVIFPRTFKTIEYNDATCLNFNGVTITFDISFQFKAKQDRIYDLTMQFRNFSMYESVLKSAGKSAVQIVCSRFDTDDMQLNRSRLENNLREQIKDALDPYDCDVNDVQLNDIRRPSKYETAIQGKQAAAENVEVAEGRRPKALIEIQTNLQEAYITSNTTIQKAVSKARILQHQAATEARAIIDRFTKETETYGLIAQHLNLSANGIVSYLGIRTIESSKNPVYVRIQSPAITSYTERP